MGRPDLPKAGVADHNFIAIHENGFIGVEIAGDKNVGQTSQVAKASIRHGIGGVVVDERIRELHDRSAADHQPRCLAFLVFLSKRAGGFDSRLEAGAKVGEL